MRKRAWPLLALACAASAVLLSLSVSGTLSSWTSAVINNSSNTVATAKAVILQETDSTPGHGSLTCYSSDSTATCSSINKYGGAAAPMTPGSTPQVTTVTFTNIGSAPGSSFVLTPGACSQTPVAGTGATGAQAANLCTNGELTVVISCSMGSTYVGADAWTDLVYVAGAPPTAALTHTAVLATSPWTCQFTIALTAAASVLDQGITVSQPLTWTLNK